MEEKVDEIQYKIETFKKTYNSNHLRGLDDSKIQEVKNSTDNSVLKKLIDNLAIDPLSYTPYYVQGPFFCYRYTMKSPLALEGEGDLKSFYLFGEQHQDHTGHCKYPGESLPITEYIKKLSQFSPSFFDLFLETSFIGKNSEGKYLESVTSFTKIYETLDQHDSNEDFLTRYKANERLIVEEGKKRDSSITLIKNNFLNCLQPETRDDPDCKLMRIHNLDIRSPFGITEITDSFYFDVLNKIIAWSHILNENKFQGFRIIFKVLNWTRAFYILIKLLNGNELSFDRYMEILKTDRLFCKQLYKRTYLKDMLIEFARVKFNDCVNQANSKLGKFKSSLPTLFVKIIKNCNSPADSATESKVANEDDVETECQSKIIDESYVLEQSRRRKEFGKKDFFPRFENFNINEMFILSEFLEQLAVLQTDIYCLSRIFKKYIPKEGTNPEMPDESRNIIVYAGAEHTRNYIEFLNMYAEREPRCNLVKTFDFESISKKGCVRIYDTPEDEQSKIQLQKFNEKYNKASKYVPF